MVRDRFIADQHSCGLRRHLDSVPPDTPIRERVDHCRVWESHSEQKRGSSPATDGHPKCKGVSSDPWEFACVGKDSFREEPWTPVSGANVVRSDRGESQEKGSGCSRAASQVMLSSLITRLLRTAQEDNPAEVKVPQDAGTWGLPVAPVPETSAQSPVLGAELVMVCFSCGRPGRGVNRCSRVNTSFPFLPSSWLVTIQDGQCRAVWPSGPTAQFQSGNEGWSAWEGQPPGPVVTTDPGGRGPCCPGCKKPSGMGITGGACT